MQIVKKDWLYDVNYITMFLIVGILGFGVLSLLFLGFAPEYHELIKQLYGKMYAVMAGILCMYPLFVLKGICPQMGTDKVYLNTTNLPYSKKQLLFKGLKQWIIVFIFYSLISSLINTLLMNSSESFISQYILSLTKPVTVLITLSLIQLNIFSGIILALARRIKWYIILTAGLFSYAVLGLLCKFIISFLNNSMAQGASIIGIYTLFSLIVFAITWKDIENIHN